MGESEKEKCGLTRKMEEKRKENENQKEERKSEGEKEKYTDTYCEKR